jgi:hypothetical protein
MKRIRPILIWFFLISMASFSISAGEHNYKPPKGYVPDAETAIKIAIAVWEPIYGIAQIQGQTPFKTELTDGIWTVTGTLPGPEKFIDDKGQEMMRVTAGGVALIKIDKESGCILRVSHGE